MSTVWIVREVEKHDISGAAEFGEITYVNGRDVSPFDIASQSENIKAALAASSPRDAIVLAGPQLMLSLLIAEFSRRYERINVLVFDPRYGGSYQKKWL
jgi:hypothetical protein